jgi:hypothetical protein
MSRWRSLVVAGTVVLCTAGPVLAQSSGSDQTVGRHSMQGEVTSVDAKKGWIHLKTAEGTMIMHFPPESLQGLKKGDRISVDLALKDNGPAPKSR